MDLYINVDVVAAAAAAECRRAYHNQDWWTNMNALAAAAVYVEI